MQICLLIVHIFFPKAIFDYLFSKNWSNGIYRSLELGTKDNRIFIYVMSFDKGTYIPYSSLQNILQQT